MYEKIVTRLRLAKAVLSRNKDLIALLSDAADAIEELSSAGSIYGKAWTLGYDAGRDENMPHWIPVTERLPNDRRDVLVYAGVMFPYITVGYYDGLWKFSFNDEEIAGSADYWMPLPEPPKEET